MASSTLTIYITTEDKLHARMCGSLIVLSLSAWRILKGPCRVGAQLTSRVCTNQMTRPRCTLQCTTCYSNWSASGTSSTQRHQTHAKVHTVHWRGLCLWGHAWRLLWSVRGRSFRVVALSEGAFGIEADVEGSRILFEFNKRSRSVHRGSAECAGCRCLVSPGAKWTSSLCEKTELPGVGWLSHCYDTQKSSNRRMIVPTHN